MSDQELDADADDPKATAAGKLSRRSHKKSRNGCVNCKRRKVKCDEARPTCYNCKRFSVRCQFPAEPKRQNVLPISAITDAHTSDGPLPKRPRGRPRKNWAALDDQVNTPLNSETQIDLQSQRAISNVYTPPSSTGLPEIEPHSQSPCAAGPSVPYPETLSQPSPIDGPNDLGLNISEAELLHHYMSCTSLTLGGSHGLVATFWWTGAVRIGLSYAFVLHLIYALSARHLAYLHPERREQLLPQAVRHSAAGLAQMSALLPHLNQENGHALYVSAILVCFNTFAAGPANSNDLLFLQDNEDPSSSVHWIQLVHGIRSISESSHHSVSFTSLLQQMSETVKITSPPPMVKSLSPSPEPSHRYKLDWEEPVEKFRAFLASALDSGMVSGAESSLKEMDAMIPNFEARFGRRNRPSSAGDLNMICLRWVYAMDDRFLQCLQNKEPLALLVLGYFMVLMIIVECENWCFEGLARHVLKGLCERLGDEYQEWLVWPTEAVEALSKSHAAKAERGV